MKFLALYIVATNLVTADLTGPHKGIAQHTIGFKNGAVVSEYLSDCSLTMTPGSPAQLQRREELWLETPFRIQSVERMNCIEWGQTNGGDDVCVAEGKPFIDQILNGEFLLNSGEKIKIFCRANDQADSAVAEALFESATRGLLLQMAAPK